MQRGLGGAHVEPQPARQRHAGVEPPQHEVRVGDRRPVAAAPVAGRPGIGSGARRPDPERTARVEPGDAAATRSHGVDVELRQAQRQAADTPLGAAPGDAVADQADVGGGAAHVEADRVGDARGHHGGDASRRA